MQRQRGELLPIGEAIGNLSPVQAIRDASPQALHHFTQADQVNLLVSASEADADLARIDHRFGNEGDFGRPERFSESFSIDPVQVE